MFGRKNCHRQETFLGLSVLDADTGRFKVDGILAQKHVQELRLRLDSEKSVLA